MCIERHFIGRTVDKVSTDQRTSTCTMIIKKRDAQAEVIKALEAQAEKTRDIIKKSACVSAVSRLRLDVTTQRATELVDFYFAQRKDWAVIHDLRLRIGTHAVQINHVLIHNSSQIVCVDSRYINCQITLARNGQYNVLNTTESSVVTSPLAKMAKDVRLLKSCLEPLGWIPKRFGFKLNVDVRGGVLVSSYAGKQDARNRMSDIGIYPSEAYFAKLCEQDRFKILRGGLSPDELHEFSNLLVQQHLPIYPSYLLEGSVENRQVA